MMNDDELVEHKRRMLSFMLAKRNEGGDSNATQIKGTSEKARSKVRARLDDEASFRRKPKGTAGKG